MTGRRLLFDVTGLLHWYAYFRNPSGIQRVSERLVNAAPLRDSPDVEFVARGVGSQRFHRLDRDLLASLADPAERDQGLAGLRARFAATMRAADPRLLARDLRWYHLPYLVPGLLRLDGLVESVFSRRWRTRRPPLLEIAPPGPRDAFFHPGDLFWQRQCAPALARLRERTGVRLVELVHDLFVFERPDWFAADLVRESVSGLSTVAPHVDRWVANSAHVRGQLARWLGKTDLGSRPIGILPMGWDSLSRALNGEADRAALRRLGLGARPFLLFVGTVEPRKNLDTLLDAHEALSRRLGPRVPDLVVVGGSGWKSAATRARLRRLANVHWLQRVQDDELAVLYRHARFSVAPSFSEGWGLPVQESLAHGLPCIASYGGALPEAAHGLATLFDPYDRGALETAMAHWIVDDEALALARNRVAEGGRIRRRPSWDDAAAWLMEYALSDGPASRAN